MTCAEVQDGAEIQPVTITPAEPCQFGELVSLPNLQNSVLMDSGASEESDFK